MARSFLTFFLGPFALALLTACSAAPPTAIVVEITRVAEVTREVEVTRLVEVTREVVRVQEVEVTRVVPLEVTTVAVATSAPLSVTATAPGAEVAAAPSPPPLATTVAIVSAAPPPPAGCWSWQAAASHIGEAGCVEGTVSGVGGTSGAFFVNFSAERNSFYVVSFDWEWEELVGECVRVEGRISEYRGRPQMIVDDPSSQLRYCGGADAPPAFPR